MGRSSTASSKKPALAQVGQRYTAHGRYPPPEGTTMLLPHAQTLAQARSCVAALADRALPLDASSAYERVLLELDRVHEDNCPALDTDNLTDNRDILRAIASNAIEELQSHGVDPLSVELILAMLVDAHDLDID
jgi:hypothetical protein